jgi:hypothetical protein
MARSFTLLQLRTKVRERADIVASQYITDTELSGYISASYTRLYDIIVKSGLHYYDKTQTITTTGGGTTDYTLPSDFYGTVGVDYQLDSQRWVEVPELMVHNRNAFLSSGSRALAYRVVAGNISLYPAPPSGQTYRHIYIPYATNLSADGDTVDGVDGWEEYIVIDAAIKCLTKEESDTSHLERERALLRDDIEQAAQNRAWANPRVVTDVGGSWDDREITGDPANWRVR